MVFFSSLSRFEPCRASHGSDAVRTASKSTKKRPPASCEGHESHRHFKTPRAHSLFILAMLASSRALNVFLARAVTCGARRGRRGAWGVLSVS